MEAGSKAEQEEDLGGLEAPGRDFGGLEAHGGDLGIDRKEAVKRKKKPKLETVAENVNKEEVENFGEEDFEDLGNQKEEFEEEENHSEFEIEGEPQVCAEISHEK